jgi:DNA-binding CsgD family transcriptional regulator
MDVTSALTRGRDAYDRQAWAQAYEELAAADRHSELDADDLHRLGMAALLAGRDDDMVLAWDRAHHALIEEGRPEEASRTAFWLGINLGQLGQHAQAGAWLGRAREILDEHGLDGVERAYLLAPGALMALDRDPEQSLASFTELTGIADRLEDPDGQALGRLGLGQALVRLGRTGEGVQQLDAAMWVVTSSPVSPHAAGLVYCGVIIWCRKVFDLSRAHEWTEALSRWCDRQDGLAPFRGQCLVHRSEIKQLHGDWEGARREVEDACAHLSRRTHDPIMGMARYQQAELLRLRGRFNEAEEAYREASQWGHPVHPGLALLRLDQGRLDDARASIVRVVEESGEDVVRRSRVLAAYSQIMLAAGEATKAATAVTELEALAKSFEAPYLKAVAATERGCVLLASDDATAASEQLRTAWGRWQELDCPYELARVRMLLADAFGRLGDHDTAALELAAARKVFAELGAAPALAHADALVSDSTPASAPGGLTAREVEVIRLVATGATNRQIAEQLVVSEKTVARHLNNIFTKLDLGSRASATAWAYEHGLA